MSNMIIVADAVNAKIDRIIKALERIKGGLTVSEFIVILESIKVWDFRINTDNEVYVAFKDKEIMRVTIGREVIK